MHTLSSVKTDPGILSLIPRELKSPHRFGESTRVFARRTFTSPVPTSSAIPFLEFKLVRVHLHYSLVILILRVFLMMIFLLHISPHLSLCVLFTLFSFLSCLYVFLWTHILLPSLYQKPYLSQVGRIL